MKHFYELVEFMRAGATPVVTFEQSFEHVSGTIEAASSARIEHAAWHGNNRVVFQFSHLDRATGEGATFDLTFDPHARLDGLVMIEREGDVRLFDAYLDSVNPRVGMSCAGYVKWLESSLITAMHRS